MHTKNSIHMTDICGALFRHDLSKYAFSNHIFLKNLTRIECNCKTFFVTEIRLFFTTSGVFGDFLELLRQLTKVKTSSTFTKTDIRALWCTFTESDVRTFGSPPIPCSDSL